MEPNQLNRGVETTHATWCFGCGRRYVYVERNVIARPLMGPELVAVMRKA